MKPFAKGFSIYRHSPCFHGFSLVEVVLALGISTFAIIAVIALFPVGLESTRNSLDESAAQNALSAIVADRTATQYKKSSAIYNLPALTTEMTATTGTFGIADNSQARTELPQARYRIEYTINPPATGTLGPYVGHFKASWPAMNAVSANCVEVMATFPQP